MHSDSMSLAWIQCSEIHPIPQVRSLEPHLLSIVCLFAVCLVVLLSSRCAVQIQRMWRGYRGRTRADAAKEKKRLLSESAYFDQAATQIQKMSVSFFQNFFGFILSLSFFSSVMFVFFCAPF